ncbi:MAG: GGDEF domain-containing protein [Gammaproteobacteria bacterium]|nr:GGDEF domain-containing protein [Gammaproteobacteria bacterium]
MSETPVFPSAPERHIARLRIATAVAYVAAFALLTFIVAFGIGELRGAHNHLESVMRAQAAKARVVTETQVASFRRAESVLQLMLETDPFAQDRIYMDYLRHGFDVGDGRNKTRELLSSDAERAVMARQDEIVAGAAVLHERIADLARAGEFERARRLFDERVDQLHVDGHATFQALRRLHEGTAEAAVAGANLAYHKTFNMTIANMLLGMLAAIGIGVLSYRASGKISRRLSDNVGDLRRLALHDSLTGLLNRTAFSQVLEQQVTQRDGFALLYMDLDGFKQVNDLHGHDTGDHLLMMAAARIRSRMRGIDVVARYGGDEFVALIQGADGIGECEHAARHVLEAFDQPFVVGAVAARIGISIGVAVAPAHGRSATRLLAAADRAMYRAKHGGSNRYVVYRPTVELAVNNDAAG